MRGRPGALRISLFWHFFPRKAPYTVSKSSCFLSDTALTRLPPPRASLCAQQNDLQAMARCHRIGQEKEVTVYRLISKDTYEEQLFGTASRKYAPPYLFFFILLSLNIPGIIFL